MGAAGLFVSSSRLRPGVNGTLHAKIMQRDQAREEMIRDERKKAPFLDK